MEPRIRWTQKQQNLFNKLRRAYNAKISRLENNPDFDYQLPKRARKKDIQTRKDLIRFEKEARDLLKRGSEKIVTYKGHKMPEYEKKFVQRAVRAENQRRAWKRRKMTEEVGLSRRAKEPQFFPVNVDKERTEKEWQDFIKSMRAKESYAYRRKKDETLKANYIKRLREMGVQGEMLADVFETIDASDLADFNGSADDCSITFTYDKIDQERITTRLKNNAKEFFGDAFKVTRKWEKTFDLSDGAYYEYPM